MMPVLMGLWIVPGLPGACVTSWLLHLRDKTGQDNGSLEELLALSMVWGSIFWAGVAGAAGFGLWSILR